MATEHLRLKRGTYELKTPVTREGGGTIGYSTRTVSAGDVVEASAVPKEHRYRFAAATAKEVKAADVAPAAETKKK